jgi:HlyD family secretion protein
MSASSDHEVPVASGERESARQDGRDPGKRLLKFLAGLIGLAVVVGLGYGVLASANGGRDVSAPQTATVKRGDLTVTVTEGGALRAMESFEVRNEAQAPWPSTDYKRAILWVIEEGTVITEQDVEDGMVLVRLNSADLVEREAQTQIYAYNWEANCTRAREDCEIQKKQNQSDIAAAELNVKFTRMELDRYLGASLAAQVVKEEGGFADLAEDERLGGIARKELRRYGAQVELAADQVSLADEKLRWAKRLHEREWISATEVKADQLAVNRRRRQLEAAEEELRLFKRYTLPKEARLRQSNHAEAMRALARVRAQARSRLAQAEAELKAANASYETDLGRLAQLRESLEKCTIRAPRPGPVVYASTGESWREPVDEGTRLWPKERIILIPDPSTLAARVKVHETSIGKLKLGQPARVTVEAMPGEDFAGTVAAISSVASPAEAWTNPELKVYEVDVALDEPRRDLTPGMSATAEIVVARLEDVLCVSVEAVAARDGQWFCSAAGAEGPELRRVEPGQITEDSVEVRSGLAEGNVVYLDPSVEPPAPPRRGGDEPIPTVTVERGDFTVSVTQRGAVYSMEPLEFKNEVEGHHALLEIVEEGTFITEEDVEKGMVLARLNSSELEEQEGDRQIRLYRAEAAHVKAREDYGIQQKQNESDIALAELNAEFGRLELDRYVGAELAAQIVSEANGPARLLDGPALGGVARQQLRHYESQMELATEELLRAEEDLRWSRQLYAKGYISRNELEDDELAAMRLTAQLEAAREDLDLFRRYTLPKQAEQRYSDCVEAARELERVKARALARLARAEARLKSSEAAQQLAEERLNKTREQIEKCTVRASQPGQVIYGSRSDPIWYRWGEMALRPGVGMEENRTIIRIPDPSTLAAVVDIPEADIQKVEVGQPARISLESAPGKVLAGRVDRVSPMASSEESWVNPEGKVYETEVALEEMPEEFIPGMSANVEIIAARLEGVLYVPAQAVIHYGDLPVCWVKGEDGPLPRVVEVGRGSDVFVEIESGLNAGEEVYLAPPPERAEELLAGLPQPTGP